MAKDITNPRVITFCNERLRVMADLSKQLRRTAEQFMVEVLEIEDLLSGNANGDIIVDGSALDGRKPITKQNLLEVKFVVNELKVTANTDDRAALIEHVAVNGLPLF